jgi:Lamin Tail Domain
MRSLLQRLLRALSALVLVSALVGAFAFSMFAPARAAPGPGPKPTPPATRGLATSQRSFAFGTPVGSLRVRAPRLAAPGDVVINEVVTDPQTDWSSNGFSGVPGGGAVSPVDEFVELYIKTADLNLGGWTIALNDGSPGSGDLTSAGAFQVSRYVGPGSFAATGAGAYLVLGNPAGSSSMSNNIVIVLSDDHGTVIDQVQLGGGAAPSGNATGPDDEAVARVPNGVDTGDDASDFIQQAATPGTANNPGAPPPPATATPTLTVTATATGPSPTPTATLTPSPTRTPSPSATVPGPAAGTVLLNEFLPHPAAGQQEFIELINRSAQAVDLGGWQLDDAPGGSQPYTLPGGTLIGPGGLLAFGKDVTGIALNDDGDTVRLLTPDGGLADAWTYKPAPKAGTSWARIPDGGAWNPRGIPSPGLPNQAAPGPSQPGDAAIGDFRNWPDGAWLSVSGFVSVPPGLFSTRTIHIQDATGGVTVYLGRDNWPPLAVGQPIRLQLGYLRHRSGDLQLYVRNGWHIQAGAADVPVSLAPRGVSTGQIGETTAGALVMVTGRVTQLESGAFRLDDGSGEARVFFAAGTGLGAPNLSVGENWRVTGVVVENTTAGSAPPSYRLQPRFAADLSQIVAGPPRPYVLRAAAAPSDTPEPTATDEH